MTATKVCRACRVPKPLTDFYRNRSKADGRADECKACKNAYARWRRQNDLFTTTSQVLKIEKQLDGVHDRAVKLTTQRNRLIVKLAQKHGCPAVAQALGITDAAVRMIRLRTPTAAGGRP